jgi:hypothetical protein
MGSSVYFILLFIDFPPSSPITCAKDSNDILAVGKSNGHDSSVNAADTVKPPFLSTVGHILSNNSVRIKEGTLGQGKGDSVLGLILFILILVPLKASPLHS